MLTLALVQALVAALMLGLPLCVALRYAWLCVLAAVANSIDLCFTLKGCLRDK